MPFMGDPHPGQQHPSVAASPNVATAATSSDHPPLAASPKDEVYDLFVKLVDQLPPLIRRQFPMRKVTEKIQYAGLPCPPQI